MHQCQGDHKNYSQWKVDYRWAVVQMISTVPTARIKSILLIVIVFTPTYHCDKRQMRNDCFVKKKIISNETIKIKIWKSYKMLKRVGSISVDKQLATEQTALTGLDRLFRSILIFKYLLARTISTCIRTQHRVTLLERGKFIRVNAEVFYWYWWRRKNDFILVCFQLN